jgi:hypothetical protein
MGSRELRADKQELCRIWLRAQLCGLQNEGSPHWFLGCQKNNFLSVVFSSSIYLNSNPTFFKKNILVDSRSVHAEVYWAVWAAVGLQPRRHDGTA